MLRVFAVAASTFLTGGGLAVCLGGAFSQLAIRLLLVTTLATIAIVTIGVMVAASRKPRYALLAAVLVPLPFIGAFFGALWALGQAPAVGYIALCSGLALLLGMLGGRSFVPPRPPGSRRSQPVAKVYDIEHYRLVRQQSAEQRRAA